MKYLLDAGVAPTTGTNGWITIAMLGVMLVAFYFFLYRPQKKQEKTVNEMRNSLQVGDEITTTGGIIGKVISMKDETLMLETGKNAQRYGFCVQPSAMSMSKRKMWNSVNQVINICVFAYNLLLDQT